MIRQAISCDVCGTEKRQTNNWFIAYDQGGELRVGGWNSRNRSRPGAKHLCGQTCLHKLVDEFVARIPAVKMPQAAQESVDREERATESRVKVIDARSAGTVTTAAANKAAGATDTSLTPDAAYEEFESSARLIPSPVLALPAPVPVLLPAEAAPAAATAQKGVTVQPPEDAPRFTLRNWRAEAWEREREREQRAVNHHREITSRRISRSK